MTNQEKLAIYKAIFRGRTGAFPRRWEKNGKSGWTPAYSFDWNEFNAHRARGGTIKDFKDKTLLPLTDSVLLNHLLGKETAGVYPILEDNTSYFIAADFDEAEWKSDSKKLVDKCAELGIKAYTEISRSGNGCHVWIFFDSTYPCWKSRAILLELIRKIFGYSEFAKEISFDRLFPNQDTITDGGFGNLIALPLQGERVAQGASLFCDPAIFVSHPNQWEFLMTIHKHTVKELDSAHDALFSNSDADPQQSNISSLKILLDGAIRIKKQGLPSGISTFIREELNLSNNEYVAKKRMGKSVFGTEKYFNLIHDNNDELMLPRGFLEKFTDYLDKENIAYKITENYKKHKTVKFKSNITLHKEQAKIIAALDDKTNGIIISPPGSGKTIIALELIARLGLPTLILVNRNQLLSQWVERVEQFLGIPKTQIGVISGVKKKVGKQIAIATI